MNYFVKTDANTFLMLKLWKGIFRVQQSCLDRAHCMAYNSRRFLLARFPLGIAGGNVPVDFLACFDISRRLFETHFSSNVLS